MGQHVHSHNRAEHSLLKDTIAWCNSYTHSMSSLINILRVRAAGAGILLGPRRVQYTHMNVKWCIKMGLFAPILKSTRTHHLTYRFSKFSSGPQTHLLFFQGLVPLLKRTLKICDFTPLSHKVHEKQSLYF